MGAAPSLPAATQKPANQPAAAPSVPNSSAGMPSPTQGGGKRRRNRKNMSRKNMSRKNRNRR